MKKLQHKIHGTNLKKNRGTKTKNTYGTSLINSGHKN